MLNRFLVYGTLRVGNGAYSGFGLDRSTTKLATVRIPGTLYHLGGFPGAVLDGDLDGFWADLLEVNSDVDGGRLIEQLDGYEGYMPHHPENSLYLRRTINVPEYGEAYIYEINSDMSERQRIEGGDWNAARTASL